MTTMNIRPVIINHVAEVSKAAAAFNDVLNELFDLIQANHPDQEPNILTAKTVIRLDLIGAVKKLAKGLAKNGAYIARKDPDGFIAHFDSRTEYTMVVFNLYVMLWNGCTDIERDMTFNLIKQLWEISLVFRDNNAKARA